MAIVRVLASWERDTLLPEDRTVNQWHCTTQDDDPVLRFAQAALFITALSDFYHAVDAQFATSLAGTGEFRGYDLAEPEPRVPFITVPDTLTPGATSQPGEVACCFSFHAEIESGDIAARKKNRVYLGPLADGAKTAVTGGVRPTTSWVNDVVAAGAALLAASDLATTWTWQTFSPTQAAATGLISGIDPVVGGWVDNAFDTMRSRGLVKTARTEFP